MKLAEALSIRKDLQKRIQQLGQRIQNNVKVQEGDEPAGQLPAGLADATADTGDARECAPECLPADAPLEGEVECERDGKEDVAR